MNVDARGGTLNNVGRDQYNLRLIIDGSTSERTVSGILRDFGLVPQLLIDRRESSDDRALVQELKTLQQTLTLVGLAIQTYEYTPLG
jgi:hypothetical protein